MGLGDSTDGLYFTSFGKILELRASIDSIRFEKRWLANYTTKVEH